MAAGEANRRTRIETPLMSIGLPVFNGERYLRFALDSIITQTFTKYELIISDNASTDNTMQICQEYAARDSRIRYVRNVQNIGAAENFNRVFSLARGKYFKWAAADDLISPTFLEKCVAALENDPSLVLCYSKADRINSSGKVDGTYDYEMKVDAFEPHVRFSDLILINHFCVAIFGVVRRDVLENTPLIGKYVGSDRVLLAELGLRGRQFEIPEYLFHRRDHPLASGRMYNKYNRLSWFDPARKSQLNPVYTRVGMEYIRSVQRVDIPVKEKFLAYQSIARWFIKRRRFLLDDLKAAIYQTLPFSKNIIHFARKIFHKQINSGGGI